MRRAGIMLTLMLLAGSFEAFAQTVDDLLAEAEARVAQLDKKPNLKFGYSLAVTKGKTTPTDALQTGLKGTWWREASWIQALALTADQRKKMDDAFLQNRIRLIDLTAALEKEELLLEPLVEAVRP